MDVSSSTKIRDYMSVKATEETFDERSCVGWGMWGCLRYISGVEIVCGVAVLYMRVCLDVCRV